LIDGLAQSACFAREVRGSVDVHHEREWRARWVIRAPLDDELLDVAVEVAVMERRGVDVVEKLLDVGDVHLDQRVSGRNLVV
jgi:hypothetical protein